MNDSFQNKYQHKLVSTFFTVLIWGICSIYFWQDFIQSGFNLIAGNLGDNRLIICLHEHWYNVFNGRDHWLDPLFFFPAENILGFSDAYFLNSLVYSIFRAAGADVYLSFQFTLIFLTFLGFIFFYFLCRKYIQMNLFFSIAGSIVFTFSCAMAYARISAQNFSVYLSPILVFLILRCVRNFHVHYWRSLSYGGSASILLALLFYTSFNFSWFFLFFLCLFSLFFLIISKYKLTAFLNKRDISLIVLIFMAFIIALVPFLITYLPVAREGFERTFSDAFVHLITVGDLINFTSTVWAKTIGSLQAYSSDLHRYSNTPGVVITFFATGFFWFYMTTISDRTRFLIREKIAVSLFVTIVFCWLLLLRFGEFTLWSLVYDFIPGASANRVVVRFQFVISFFGNLFIFYSFNQIWYLLPKLQKKTLISKEAIAKLFLVMVSIFLIVEQICQYPVGGIDRKLEQTRFSGIPNPPEQAEAFFITESNQSGRSFLVVQIDAMIIAQMTGLPTINGYSGWLPSGWNFSHTQKDIVYPYQIAAWLEKKQYTGNIVAFDISKKKWCLFPLEAVYKMSTVQVEISERTPHNVGKFRILSNRKGEMHADIGESGALVFGPYLPLRSGKYKAIFDISATGTPSEKKPFAIIDINLTTQGSLISKELFLREPVEKQKHFLEFDVDEHSGPKDLYETRVIVIGNAEVGVSEITLNRF